MIFIKNTAILFYRIWFYLLMFFYILLVSPLLIISILREEWYSFFFRLARGWAKFVLFGMGFKPIIDRDVTYLKDHSYMFVANHTSMIDIMLMLYVTKSPFVFVGKKELSKIPVFGFFYKRTCILVDRDSKESRRAVFKSAQNRLKQGFSICIFPEGGVPDDESIVLDVFRDGAFRLAIEHQIPIAPMTFLDNKKRFSYTFFSGGPGPLRVKIHNLIPTKGLQLHDKKALNEETRSLIFKTLQNDLEVV